MKFPLPSSSMDFTFSLLFLRRSTKITNSIRRLITLVDAPLVVLVSGGDQAPSLGGQGQRSFHFLQEGRAAHVLMLPASMRLSQYGLHSSYVQTFLSKSPEYLSCIIIARIQPPDSSLPGSPLHHYQQMNLNTTTKLNSRATLS